MDRATRIRCPECKTLTEGELRQQVVCRRCGKSFQARLPSLPLLAIAAIGAPFAALSALGLLTRNLDDVPFPSDLPAFLALLAVLSGCVAGGFAVAKSVRHASRWGCLALLGMLLSIPAGLLILFMWAMHGIPT